VLTVKVTRAFLYAASIAVGGKSKENATSVNADPAANGSSAISNAEQVSLRTVIEDQPEIPPKHQDPRGAAFPSAPPMASGAAREEHSAETIQQPSQPPIAAPEAEAKANLHKVIKYFAYNSCNRPCVKSPFTPHRVETQTLLCKNHRNLRIFFVSLNLLIIYF
jgi:hypothetical protein